MFNSLDLFISTCLLMNIHKDTLLEIDLLDQVTFIGTPIFRVRGIVDLKRKPVFYAIIFHVKFFFFFFFFYRYNT